MDDSMSAPPATFGASSHGLRGDYRDMRPDYTVTQDYAAYDAAAQERWRRLYQRQMKLVPARACDEFLRVVETLDYGAGIPRFDQVNERLGRATRWQVVAVPGLLPEPVFFGHLAERRFPVTVWLREEAEFDYIVEPDVFHDFFGHVPLLFDRTYAEHLYEYGKGGLKAMRLDAVKLLARLYWYTIEFGLIRVGSSARAYGAGLLSSGGELAYCVEDPRPRRLPFDLERIMCTEYQIDRYQETYFVIDSFDQLMRETAPDFTPIYARLRASSSGSLVS
jgi:phenylalanine-4-hydroxylase